MKKSVRHTLYVHYREASGRIRIRCTALVTQLDDSSYFARHYLSNSSFSTFYNDFMRVEYNEVGSHRSSRNSSEISLNDIFHFGSKIQIGFSGLRYWCHQDLSSDSNAPSRVGFEEYSTSEWSPYQIITVKYSSRYAFVLAVRILQLIKDEIS